MQLKSFAIALAATAAILGAAACSDDENDTQANTSAASPTSAATTAPTAAPRPLQDVLKEALNEQYKARAGYQASATKFPDAAAFSAAATGATKSIEALTKLYAANNLTPPPDIFAGRVPAAADVKKACTDAADTEKANATLYDKLAKETTNADLVKALQEIKKTAQETNTPAFEACAK